MVFSFFLFILCCFSMTLFSAEEGSLVPIGYLHFQDTAVLLPYRPAAKGRVFPRGTVFQSDQYPQTEIVANMINDCQCVEFFRFSKQDWDNKAIRRDHARQTFTLLRPCFGSPIQLYGRTEGEIPVLYMTPSGWTARIFIPELERFFLFSIPEDAEEVRFETFSEKEKYHRDQQQKGLVLYEDEWMTEEEAESLRSEKKIKLSSDKMIVKRSVTVGKSGFIILSDSTIRYGKPAGTAGTRLFFVPDGTQTSVSFHADSLSHQSVNEQLCHGYTILVTRTHGAAESALKNRFYASVETSLAEMEKYLMQLQQVAPNEHFMVYMRNEHDRLTRLLHQKLKEADLVLYAQKVFSREVYERQAVLGNIYFNGVWIKPEQRCTVCQARGEMKCPDCDGRGERVSPCPGKCDHGKQTCQICDGEGVRPCLKCKGHGKSGFMCPVCNGAGRVIRVRAQAPQIFTGVNGFGIRRAVIGPWYEPYDTQCSACRGSGLENRACKQCQGKGRLSCPETRACSECAGKGELRSTCTRCKGEGDIECLSCQGKKYTGLPAL